MIIRHKQKGRFVQIPNAIFEDRQLSLEAKGMLGSLLSRPPKWIVRHGHLRKTHGIGRKKLERIMDEINLAGYIDRDEYQGRDEHNRFTTYNYVISDLPNGNSNTASTNNSDVHPAQRPQPQSARHADNKKESAKTDLSKLPPKSSLVEQDEPPQATEDQYSDYGRRALANGLTPVFENSGPFKTWELFRGVDGMPPIDEAIIAGKRRRIVWMPALYPPRRRETGNKDDFM